MREGLGSARAPSVNKYSAPPTGRSACPSSMGDPLSSRTASSLATSTHRTCNSGFSSYRSAVSTSRSCANEQAAAGTEDTARGGTGRSKSGYAGSASSTARHSRGDEATARTCQSQRSVSTSGFTTERAMASLAALEAEKANLERRLARVEEELTKQEEEEQTTKEHRARQPKKRKPLHVR